MLRYVVIVAVFLFCSALLHAETLPVVTKKERPLAVALYFGTGMITFQDLYVPRTNTDPFVPDLRADGNIRTADSLDHIGIGVECGLGISYRHNERYRFDYELGYRRAGSLGLQGTHADSSYANTFTAVKGFYSLTKRLSPGFGLTMQRVAFSNLSRAHTVLSLLPSAELQLPLDHELTVGGFVGYALWNRLGYASNTQFLGKKFTRAHTKTWKAGLAAHKKLNRSTSIALHASRESIRIQLDDINSYRRFGLTLFADEPTPKDTQLYTNTISVSMQRDF